MMNFQENAILESSCASIKPNRLTGGYMAEINLDESKLKDLFKIAIIEVFQEQKEVFYDLLSEILEDLALEKAIKEGKNTETVSREAIFKILESKG